MGTQLAGFCATAATKNLNEELLPQLAPVGTFLTAFVPCLAQSAGVGIRSARPNSPTLAIDGSKDP